jgi:hypothetical protein
LVAQVLDDPHQEALKLENVSNPASSTRRHRDGHTLKASRRSTVAPRAARVSHGAIEHLGMRSVYDIVAIAHPSTGPSVMNVRRLQREQSP